MSSLANRGGDETPPPQQKKSTRFRFAVALNREGKRTLASKEVDQLLTECPEHAKAWALKSTMERESRKAVATAEKGYAARPDLAATRRALCAALTRLDFEEQGSKKRTSFALLLRAADVCPDDARAQFRLGRAARQLKDSETARKAFKATLALDPQHERAEFWLAALGDGPPPMRAPIDHLKALYDDYAPRYDDHLSKTLESKAPDLVASALASHLTTTTRKKLTGIDLGSGTGLSGSALTQTHLSTSRVQWRGVDLSTRMCELASKRGCYQDVRSVDLLDALREDPPYDCFVSCDVLVYFGSLDPFFSAAAANAKKNADPAFLAVTLEDSDSNGWDLTATGRFRHSPSYVLDVAKSHHWINVDNQQAVLRRQSGKPVVGRIYVFSFDYDDDDETKTEEESERR